MIQHALLTLLALAGGLWQATGSSVATDQEVSPEAPVWGVRQAEHLINRAGFGAPSHEIEHLVSLGREGAVAWLLLGDGELEPFFVERPSFQNKAEYEEFPEPLQKRLKNRFRSRDKKQLVAFGEWWLERMASGESPLQEKMTLFWHGFFTSSFDDVKNSVPMIRQNELFRSHALGNYATLVHEIVHDPAMLVYLDNDANRKNSPNENLARELMELYTLGEGHFTEEDVQGAARALTGYGRSRPEFEYEFYKRRHDSGKKTILGVTGGHDAKSLVDTLLAQEQCARFVAGRVITWFEGVAPEAERLESYANLLRESEYELAPLLERLFLDEAFYRDEVIGTRVLSPVEFLVGTSRRLEMEAPAKAQLFFGELLGQKLFFPPSVKGWDEGEAWINTASLMMRGNLMGLLLGQITVEELFEMDPEFGADVLAKGTSGGFYSAEDPATMEEGDEDDSMMAGGDEMMMGEMGMEEDPVAKRASKVRRTLSKLEESGWRPRIFLCARMRRAGVQSPADLVDTLAASVLAIELPRDTRKLLIQYLRDEVEATGLRPERILHMPGKGEPILRRLLHLMLSLPEAQLG